MEEGDYKDISRHQCVPFTQRVQGASRNLELCPITSCMNLQDSEFLPSGVLLSIGARCKLCIGSLFTPKLPVSKGRTISVSPKEDTRNPLSDSSNTALFTGKFPFLSFLHKILLFRKQAAFLNTTLHIFKNYTWDMIHKLIGNQFIFVFFLSSCVP